MGIDTILESIHRSNIYGNANELRNLRTQLENYKSSISQNWQGEEVTYIIQAINQAINKIDSIASKIEGLGDNVLSVAKIIKEEEKIEEEL